MLTEVKYSEEQLELFDYLNEIGAVLETVIMTSEGSVADVYESSKAAALTGMKILTERAKKEIAKVMEKHPQYTEANFGKLEIYADKIPIGADVDLRTFMGDGYDLRTGEVGLYKYKSNDKAILGQVTDGFAYALLSTPHGLRFDRNGDFATKAYEESENTFYSDVIVSYLKIILFVDDVSATESLQIISWSDDWSNYFDEGKEWWGTFCWTIYDPRYNTIAFIVASTTD